ncbi:MAG: non-canonical purine NTP pyrophosphatase [Patescibacteria group bacterium]|nr:non-canonical purine NTP pyrophosphatase [Patescibacteria group bacterium]
MQLLIATFNQGKLEDYQAFCKDWGIKAVNLKDIGADEEFEEKFGTFEENAAAKAEFYAKLSHLPTLADDSGIEIPYYGMEPGVKTKRWAGNEVSGHSYFDFILQKVKQMPENQRQGQMRAVLALRINGETHLAEGVVKGRFTDKVYDKSFTPDYPWDSIFVLEENGKYYEELNLEENLKYNHRRIAFEKLKPFLIK